MWMTAAPESGWGSDNLLIEVTGRILERYRNFWPLPVKQVFYQVASEGKSPTDADEYKLFERQVRSALISGRLPLVALSEGSEEVLQGGAWDDPGEFIWSEIESFLWGYRRNLVQGQKNYLEVWVEKPGVLGVIANVAVEYCVTTVCCRSLPSVSFMASLRERLSGAHARGQSAVILFFGDRRSGGAGFATQVQELLRSEGNLWEMELSHECVSEEDIAKYSLPEHEDGYVELETLPPDLLTERVRSSIESRLDMALVNNQRTLADREGLKLTRVRTAIMRKVRPILKDLVPKRDE